MVKKKQDHKALITESLQTLGKLGQLLHHLDSNPESIEALKVLLGPQFDIRLLHKNREQGLDLLLNMSVAMGVSLTVAKILRATADVVGKDGIHVSVEQILSTADISRRTFYQSFKNREEALKTLYAVLLSLIRISLHNLLKQIENPKELFSQLCLSFINLYSAGGALLGHLTADAIRSDSEFNPFFRYHCDICQERIHQKLKVDFGIDLSPLLIRGYILSQVAYGLDFNLTPGISSERLNMISDAMMSFTRVWTAGLTELQASH